MNTLDLGFSDKTELLRTKQRFLLIDHGPLCDAFVESGEADKRRAIFFDPHEQSFDPLRVPPRVFVDVIDAAFTRGDTTLTKDTGLDYIAEALERRPASLEALIPEPDKKSTPGHIWAYGKIRRILRSPVLKRVFCGETNFTIKKTKSPPTIIARIDRAEIGNEDAFILVSFLAAQYPGQIINSDFGPYAAPFYADIIAQDRLAIGLKRLSELSADMQNMVLGIENKRGRRCTYDDAVTLAKHARLRPDLLREDNPYNRFIDEVMA